MTEFTVLGVDAVVRTTADDLLDMLHAARPAWHTRAACRGQTAVMWPTLVAGRQDQFAEAVKVCNGCPVITECSEQGSREQFGVWGGVPKWTGRTTKADAA